MTISILKILDLSADASSEKAGSAKGSSEADLGLFRAHLSTVTSAKAAVVSAAPAATVAVKAASPANALATLQKKILEQLQGGQSAADIAAQLAASLASTIAAKLGTTDPHVMSQLQTAFASTLAPPGQTGPPESAADLARTLAQRFADMAKTATRVATSTGDPGQLNRFVGNILDAVSAKETPAQQPVTKTTLVTPAVSSAPTDAAIPPAGDGRSVAIAPSQAIASGGNTQLGRILARAATTAPAVASAAGDGSVRAAATSSLDAAVTSFLQTFATGAAAKAGDSANAQTKGGSGDESASFDRLARTKDLVEAGAAVPAQAGFSVQSNPVVAPVTAPHAAGATDANAIVDQILHGISLKASGGSSQIRLSLVPGTLGDVSVSLTVSGGTVSAHIVAQTAEVRDALVAGQGQLSKSFEDLGMKLSSFTVDVNSGGFAGFAQQQQQQYPSANGRHSAGSDTVADDGENYALEAVPSFGPPLVAGTDLGALNYLV